MKLFRWLAWGEWRAQPFRSLLSIIAIAVGVALGFAVHLINESALDRFSAGLNRARGSADLQIVANGPGGFDEELFARLVADDGPVAKLGRAIVGVSPVVQRDVTLVGNNDVVLRVVGIDAVRAANVTPALLGQPLRALNQLDEDEKAPIRAIDWLDADAIYLPSAFMESLDKHINDTIDLNVDEQPVKLRIVGRVLNADEQFGAGATPGQNQKRASATMDIGGAQWRLNRVGVLNRIDIRLSPDASPAAVREAIAPVLPNAVRIVSVDDDRSRTSDLSRAYRVNLDMLALMALFTGAFLVYSTQSLAVARRHAHLALLRVIGVGRWRMIAQILGEGFLQGLVGGVLGLALGIALAASASRIFGGDLGGGYFSAAPIGVPTLLLAAPAAGAFFALGLAAALFGSLLPARAAAHDAPARALKSSGTDVGGALPRPWIAIALIGVGLALTQAPPIDGLPIPGYASMACLLFGGIAAMPWLARRLLAPLAWSKRLRSVSMGLAIRRLWAAPSAASVALCGIVASASLMVAMTVMIASFRNSVDVWLGSVLSANVYLRTNAVGEAGLTPDDAARLASLPGVTRFDLQKVVPLSLSPSKPAVSLIVRTVDDDPRQSLPLIKSVAVLPSDGVPVWVSEAMVDLYGATPGKPIDLPLAPALASRAAGFATTRFIVAGVWRDYARQFGSVVIRRVDYVRLTDDNHFPDASIGVPYDETLDNVIERVRAELPDALRDRSQFFLPREIREQSLSIFDRSFAITYLLQAVAIVIGLAGVATTFSAQTLARSKEFGMLRHVGVTRRQILQQIVIEGGLLGILGALAGGVLGLALSQILIHVINPQSFHWTMDTRIPTVTLAAIAVTLVVASAGTAVLAGRRALSRDAIVAVREDW